MDSRDTNAGSELARKLGVKPGIRILLEGEPAGYLRRWGSVASSLHVGSAGTGSVDLIHYFSTSDGDLRRVVTLLMNELKPAGALWISWRKGGHGGPTERSVREAGLDCGLVDVKICSVDDDWSALKFVVPRSRRPAKELRR